VLAFGMPIGVFLLISVGMIVIEHFLDTPREAVFTATQSDTVQDADAQRTAEEEEADSASAAEAESAQPAASVTPDPYLAGLDKKRVELRIRRTELLLQYTDQHPDVLLVDRQLEQLRTERRRYLRQLQARHKN
jgi:serine/threonine-protein kinase